MLSISIIVPAKSGCTARAINAIREFNIEIDNYEVLLAEGCAPSQQRNLAAREAVGDILYFLDDDSIINPGNLSLISSAMNVSDVAVTGGPSITPPGDSWIQKLFGYALASLFGSGAARNRYQMSGAERETTDKELILCNLAMRRSVFLEHGGFDERLYPNEENELLDRISQSGYKLLYQPGMYIYRSQRPTVSAFIRQMFSYGRGRSQQSLLSGSFSVISFIPMFFDIYLFLVPFFVSHVVLLVPFCLYVLLTILFTIYESVRFRSLTALLLIIIYPLMHIVNGIGLISGLISGKPAVRNDPGIVVKRLKMLGHYFEAPQ